MKSIAQDTKLALAFYQWIKENDTTENGEKWFHFSEEDMFDEFQKTYGKDVPKSSKRWAILYYRKKIAEETAKLTAFLKMLKKED